LDPDLYNGLVFLKHYAGDLEDLSLNFTVAIEGKTGFFHFFIHIVAQVNLEFGVAKSVDLMPNGNNVAVTRENRLPYIHLVSHYRLTKQIKLQSEAFFEGLSEMIEPNWLRYVIHLTIIM
jgi:ubiquitin-protein ligase E3 C